MGAPELLHHLRGAGLVLTITPGGGLHVAPRHALTDDHRAAIRAERDALVLALKAEVTGPPATPRRSANPLMTPEEGDECHAGGWDDAEIEVFMARSARLSARGRADAEQLAERLTLRDRQTDDRRMCLECSELEHSGRCGAARRGALTSTDRRFEPTQNILVRCPAFRGSDPDSR